MYRRTFEHTLRVDAPPSAVFAFFENISRNYRLWHPAHRFFRWERGDRPGVGAVCVFEEEIAGRRMRGKEFAAVQRHMEEEGRNLKLLLEAKGARP